MSLLWPLLILWLLVAPNAFSQTTRNLEGVLTLDVGTAPQNMLIDITVNNHSFVVVPPSFTIIRPITSKETVQVLMPSGESSVAYRVTNILTEPVDYTVAIRCEACRDTLPTQYYSPRGNRFGFASEVYIDPENLPNTLALTAATRARIKGAIVLQDNAVAERALTFDVRVASADNPALEYQSQRGLVMPAGQRSIDYAVNGLRRSIGDDRFRVSVQCQNCVGKSRAVQVFPRVLSPVENHLGIDFTVTDDAPPAIEPAINLLLEHAAPER